MPVRATWAPALFWLSSFGDQTFGVISHAGYAAEKMPHSQRVLCPSGLARSPPLFLLSSFGALNLGVLSHPGCVAKNATSPVCLKPVDSGQAPQLFFSQAKKLSAVVFVAIVNGEVDNYEN
ncbi:hypothetical protein QOZ98_002457 [Planomicrobium stackebrandtii]|uniref:Secreted protein n=1 Tax=Planomicrobium stackebrandtii TaxID=253160 RepID=A0ABU0GW78_9BACL|nr:hypothetical protein [Planomicrobium stackebrandtii]MDQ0429629.1 hypothetical protein [Planomicrobium stackebrandtii]